MSYQIEMKKKQKKTNKQRIYSSIWLELILIAGFDIFQQNVDKEIINRWIIDENTLIMPWSGKRKLKNRFVVTTYFENYLILIRFHMIAAATKKKKKRTRKRKADGQHFSCSIFNDYVISSYLKIGSQPQSCLQWWLQRLFLFSISAARNSTVESSLCDNLDPSVRFFEYYLVSN